MKNIKSKNFIILLLLAISHPTYAHEFSIQLIKSRSEINSIASEIVNKNKNYAVDKEQLIAISNNDKKFIIAPSISTSENGGGCYLQTLTTENVLGPQYLIEKNNDAQSCDSILAIFGCRLPQTNGIGVIVGMRLGFNNYYSQSSFFEIGENNELRENLLLSKKIGSIDSASKAKKKLACIK